MVNGLRRSDPWIAIALALVSVVLAIAAMRAYRASGIQPFFYQENFAPAVMVSCGHGFTMPAAEVPALREFLTLKRNQFSCAELPADLKTGPVVWNASWVYLYRAVGTFWKISGITWTSLDIFVAIMCGVVTVALYAIFRVIASPPIAAVLSLVLTAARGNLTQLLSLRDYSKAPFVLAALFILSLLAVRRYSRRTTLLLAAAYGVICGVGWGFRGDLVIMLPLGALVAAICLHRPLLDRAAAIATIVITFVVAGWPVVASLGTTGACQFHYSLLGLSTPLVGAMGIGPAPYQFSDQFLDTSVAVRVFDYATRVVGDPAYTTCTPEYETASGRLYAGLVSTFPADLLLHAYGSTIFTLASGLELQAPGSLPGKAIFDVASRVLSALSPAGPVLLLAAIGVTAATSTQLAIALALVSLFLAGYPAIEYEQRHWFHLRFLPWYALLIVASARYRDWRRTEWLRTGAAIALLVATLAAALAVVRMVQTGRVKDLIRSYQAAAVEPLSLQYEGDVVKVAWTGQDRMPGSILLAADLLAIRFDPGACEGREPFTIRASYAVDANWHDLSSTMTIERPVDRERAQAFVPVFLSGYDNLEYLRFTGLRVEGAPASCVAAVGRIVDGKQVPLWLQMQVPAAGSQTPLYQTFRVPRIVRRLTGQ